MEARGCARTVALAIPTFTAKSPGIRPLMERGPTPSGSRPAGPWTNSRTRNGPGAAAVPGRACRVDVGRMTDMVTGPVSNQYSNSAGSLRLTTTAAILSIGSVDERT